MNSIPEAAAAAMNSVAGAIKRHGPDQDTQTFVAMATRLGDGMWSSIAYGVYGGRVYDQFTGTSEVIDLWLHPLDGREPMPVEWVSRCAVEPVTVLSVPGDRDLPPPATVGAAALVVKENTKLYRLDYGSRHRERNPAGPAVGAEAKVVECSIYDQPRMQMYTPGSDFGEMGPERSTICMRAGMEYISRGAYGGPLLDASGRLSGIIISTDWGNDSSHAGYFVPMDYILPSVDVALINAARNDRGRHSNGIDVVSHRSHDVDFYGY